MKKLHTALLAVLFLTLAATAVLAGGNFESLDRNGDGKVTKEEFCQAWPDKGKCEQDFKWYDRNGDGVVTKQEFEGKM